MLCTSIFVEFLFQSGIPSNGPINNDRFVCLHPTNSRSIGMSGSPHGGGLRFENPQGVKSPLCSKQIYHNLYAYDTLIMINPHDS